ncbi:MAG: DUF1573 domain-containing protein [bacterium]|nr:DUF1573 domain-containing protein [bacterium]
MLPSINFFKNPWFWMTLALVVVLGVSLFTFSSQETNSQGGQSTPPAVNSAQLSSLSGMEVSPQPFEFGDVSMGKGIVTKTFSLKNKTGKEIKVAKVETSCMCTEASLKVGDTESPYFGMPGHTSNSGWQATIPPDGEAFLTAKYDPNAHGPSGTGLAKRVVRVFFSDPQNTYSDVNFTANVVK